jgi:hypothetical protein
LADTYAKTSRFRHAEPVFRVNDKSFLKVGSRRCQSDPRDFQLVTNNCTDHQGWSCRGRPVPHSCTCASALRKFPRPSLHTRPTPRCRRLPRITTPPRLPSRPQRPGRQASARPCSAIDGLSPEQHEAKWTVLRTKFLFCLLLPVQPSSQRARRFAGDDRAASNCVATGYEYAQSPCVLDNSYACSWNEPAVHDDRGPGACRVASSLSHEYF